MSILFFVIFGLIVGLLARALIPGRQTMGLLATAVLGMVGSFVGGAVGNLIAGRSILDTAPAGFIGSVVGALLVLVAVMAAGGRRGLPT